MNLNLKMMLLFTHKTQLHQPCGSNYCVVSTVEDYCKKPFVYPGEDTVDKFLECTFEEEKEITKILSNVVPMNISEEEVKNAVYCHLCNYELGADRVGNHNHLNGEYLGSAHKSCNLNYEYKGKYR